MGMSTQWPVQVMLIRWLIKRGDLGTVAQAWRERRITEPQARAVTWAIVEKAKKTAARQGRVRAPDSSASPALPATPPSCGSPRDIEGDAPLTRRSARCRGEAQSSSADSPT